jgi:RNA exonuclease 1
MTVAVSGEREVIGLTLIDYFTGDVLIDSFVLPSVSIIDYATEYHGITGSDLYKALLEGNRIEGGRDAARAKVFEHAGPEIVVVMHGGDNDLRALSWVHGNVVDTTIVARAEGRQRVEGGYGKNLCK